MSRPTIFQLLAPVVRPATLLIGSALLSAACTTPPVGDPASRYYDIPTGSTFTVRQDIEIPPGWARAHLQGGRVVAKAALRRYEPYCEIEVNDVSATPRQVVRAGAFTIQRAWREQELGAVDRGIKLAASGATRFDVVAALLLGESGRDGGSLLVLNLVRLALSSLAQPQVRELRCAAGWADQALALYPTVAEMRGALGELAGIEIP